MSLCFHNLSLHVYLHALSSLLSRNMHGLAEYEPGWFRPPKTVQEEHSLFAQSKPKSTQCKKFALVDSGSMFKDYNVHCVQSLQENSDDLVIPEWSRQKTY